MTANKTQNKSQKEKFLTAAKQLQCDESEEAFDAKLGKLAKAKPAAKPKHKKKTPK